MIRANRFNALAGKSPDYAGRDVEKLTGRPFQFHRLASPMVEKASGIVEGEPPFGFRHACRFLAGFSLSGISAMNRYEIRWRD